MNARMGMVSLVFLGFTLGCAHRTAPKAIPDDSAGTLIDEEKDTVAARDCSPEEQATAPSDGRILRPAMGEDRGFAGRIAVYPFDGSPTPLVTQEGTSLHLTAAIPVTAKAQYAGFALSFPGCMDASAFTGVRFSIRGTYAGCSLQYATMDVAHADRYTPAVFATGSRGVYPPQTTLEREQVSAKAQTIHVPFTGHTIAGNPPSPLNPGKLTGVLWQFTVPLANNVLDGSTTCTADLFIDDVSFY